MSMNRLVRYFPMQDLRNGHDGLAKIAALERIDVNALGEGEFVAFANSKNTAVKFYTGGGVIAHVRVTKGHIDPRVIRHLPRYFNGTAFNYSQAVESMMKEQFPKWFGKKTTKEER